MLAVHKIIDALGRKNRFDILALPGVTQPMLDDAITLLRKAEKFDFGNLMLEPRPDKPGEFMFPALTAEEMGFWRDELLPLPAPVCWYEFVLGVSRSGILVWVVNGVWRTMRIDIVSDSITFDGIICVADVHNNRGADLHVEIEGNLAAVERMQEARDWLQKNVVMTIPMAIYMTLMLNSKSTDVGKEVAPPKVNKRRRMKGLEPLADHRVVVIVPKRFRTEATGTHGDRRSPRLHWRRSHVRTLESGKRIVIARMLVGRADLGQVSHEYRFAAGSPPHEAHDEPHETPAAPGTLPPADPPKQG